MIATPRPHGYAGIGARLALRAALAATLLAGGCQTAPGPNPAGLPEEARTLEYILDRGCLPYVLGAKTENEAMRGVGLTHHGPPWTFVDPPGPPRWLGVYAGLSNVVVGRDICRIHMKGAGNFAAYRAATQSVLRRRLGAAVDQDANSGSRQVLPGQITGCHEGFSYTYYATRRIFSVDLRPAATCTKTG
jgi:hypothetical protein